MRDPVTIGGQTFIFDDAAGWIDKKTKMPADKGLLTLLNQVTDETVQEEPKKKLRVKIDPSVEPVTIAGQRFVYDKNSGWIDSKTKQKAPENLNKVLTFVSPPRQAAKEDEAIANVLGTTPETMKSFGMLGDTVKKPKESELSDATREKADDVNKPLNKFIVKMIGYLASIDASLKERIKQQSKTVAMENAAQREQMIEGGEIQDERSQELSEEQLREIEEKNEEEDASPVSKLLLAGGAIAAIGLMYKPITEMIKQFSSFASGLAQNVSGSIEGLNDVFDFILSPFRSGGSDPGSEPSSEVTTPSAERSEVPMPVATPVAEQTEESSNGGALTAVATAATVATAAALSRPNATPVRPTNQQTITPPVRPTPQTTPTPRGTSSPGIIQRATGAIARSPAGRLAVPLAAATVGVMAYDYFTKGSSERSVDTGSDAAPPPAAPPAPSTPTPPAAPDANRTDGPRVSGSGALRDNVNTLFRLGGGNTGNIDNLNNIDPQFESNVVAMLTEYKQITGSIPTLTSGFRTYQEQQQISSGYMKAAPGTSKHERGLALDFNSADVNRMRSLGLLAKYGLSQRYGARDPVHIEPVAAGGGTDPIYQAAGEDGGVVADVVGPIIGGIKDVVGALRDVISTDTDFRTIASISDQASGRIAESARQTHAARVEARSQPDPRPQPTPTKPDAQNVNPDQGGTVQTIPREDDKVVLQQYIYYFGLGNTNPPVPVTMT